MPLSESSFLFLAATWLSCRWRVMGNQIEDAPHQPDHWPDAMLGMHDAEAEMRLLIYEARS